MKRSLLILVLLFSCFTIGRVAQAQPAPAPAEVGRVVDINFCEAPRFKSFMDAILCARDHCDDPTGEKDKLYKLACAERDGLIRRELTGSRSKEAVAEDLKPIGPEEIAVIERERVLEAVDAGSDRERKILAPCECLAKLEEKFHCGVTCPPPEEPKQPQVPNDTKDSVPDGQKSATGPSPSLVGSGCSLTAVAGFSDLGVFGIMLFAPLSWALRSRKKK